MNYFYTINYKLYTINQTAINHKPSTINHSMEEAIEWYIENNKKERNA